MITKGLKKYLINPSLGFLASILYITGLFFIDDIAYALVVSIIVSGICDLSLRYYVKTSVCGLMFTINFCAFAVTLIAWLILRHTVLIEKFYLVFYEIVFISLILTTRMLKTYLSLYFGKSRSSIVQKTYIGEYFEAARLIQYMLTFHLFLILLFIYLEKIIYFDEKIDDIIYYVLPVLASCTIIIYQELKIRKIVSHLRREEWLPIVNESGEVTGRVAKSVSVKMKNRFLHPVVRVALVHEGRLYLQKRDPNDTLDPSTYDHPFEKYMLFNHEINIAVRNSISRALNMQELPFNFLLKYVYENDNTKRLIILFISKIKTEEQLLSLDLLKGKFWSMKEIEASFDDKGVFSECFQLEYEYLKNTVLHPSLVYQVTPS